jgi:hypothetical protein
MRRHPGHRSLESLISCSYRRVAATTSRWLATSCVRGEGRLDGICRAQVDPMLGGVVVEREQNVEVLGDLRRGLGPLGAVVGLERLGGPDGVVLVLGVVDLRQRRLRTRMRRLRQRGEHVGLDVEPTPLLLGVGEDLAQRLPEPQGSVTDGQDRRPHAQRLQSRSRSAHDSLDSRNPSETAMTSFFPSARTPIITSRHTFSCSRRTLRWIPSTRQ